MTEQPWQIYSEVALKQRSKPQSLAFGRNSKASRKVGELSSGKGGRYWNALVFSLRKLEAGILYAPEEGLLGIGWDCIFSFSWSVLSWKRGQNWGTWQLLFFFCSHRVACGILVPWPGMEPLSPAMTGLNHWTTRQVPRTWQLLTKPLHLGLIVAGAVGQSSVLVYGLAIIHPLVYSVSELSTPFMRCPTG